MANKLLLLSIFLLSFGLRLWNLNEVGRTWDEIGYIDPGYKYVELIKNLDFKNPLWTQFPDHPPLAKYIYGIGSHFDIAGFNNGQVIYHYDLTVTRLFSAFFSALTSLLVVLLGWRFISKIVGLCAGVILSFLPIFVGLSQLVTLESILLFFFTLSIYTYLNYLQTTSTKHIIISGIALGLALSVKYSNILLFPILIGIMVIYYFTQKNINFIKLTIKTGGIFLIGILTFILLWPALWFDPIHVISAISEFRFAQEAKLPVELFMGSRQSVPYSYFVVYFLITTPIITLVLFFLGIYKTILDKKWIYLVLLVWFIIPFFQSFYYLRQNGIRYIIEIYIPFVLLCGIGFEYLVTKVTKSFKIQTLYFIPMVLYLFIVLRAVSPYYLNYFNLLVGGAGQVYHNKSFMLNWWGEGQKEALGYIVGTAQPNDSVALAVVPLYVAPPIEGLRMMSYEKNKKYDFLIVNFLYIFRNKFDESSLQNDYMHVYSVQVDGAPILKVYRARE